MKHGEIQQCITDHGTQFWKGSSEKARFSVFLEEHGIKHILTKVKHPQSNGKSEKFGHLYKVHRKAFKTLKAFIHWYNEIRPHMSLNDEIHETPEMAYQRKKKEGRLYFT
jgi:putative transposase